MFCVKKSLSGNIYCSFAPNNTLLARFWITFAIRRRPRRISFDGAVETKPSTSGATIAGQKNLRKIKAPTAVYLASWNRGRTAVDIYGNPVSLPEVYSGHGKEFRPTILHILRNDQGILVEDAQISSMKTFATMRS
jgi:hypothetical protein